MAWIDGYDGIGDAGESPHSAPGTEKTNEARPSPGPSWADRGEEGGTATGDEGGE